MPLLSFYIFPPRGKCIFFRDFTKATILSRDLVSEVYAKPNKNQTKLLFGFLFALKPICNDLSPNGSKNRKEYVLNQDSFKNVVTSEYILHHFQSLTGYRFVLFTDNYINVNDNVNDSNVNLSTSQNNNANQKMSIEEKKKIYYLFLKEAYQNLFIRHVMQNPSLMVSGPVDSDSMEKATKFINGFKSLVSRVETL